jgi:peptide/nickel transport system substrate-binding protein
MVPKEREEKMKKLTWLATALVVVTLALVSCGATPEPETIVQTVEVEKTVVETVEVEKTVVETVEVEKTVVEEVEVEKVVTPTPDPSGIKRGGTLIAGIAADPQGFDSHTTSAYSSFEILENVYDQLVTVDENLNMVPSLAESWEVSDDNLTWTFTLREGVVFHNGRPLTADDVVYSYERIMDPDTGSGVAWRFGSVESVEAVDDLTVAIHLTEPSPNLLGRIGGYGGMAIIPKEIVEDGSVDTNPVGTGPFKFVEYVPGDRVVLEANPDYWEEGKPYLDEVIFKPIPDETVRLTNLLAGEVDWVDSLPPQRVTDLATSGEVIVDKVSGGDYWYIGVNTTREPFDDVRVRQAIAYAINRADVTAAAKWDTAKPNQGPISSDSFWYYDYQPYDQDLETARQLLADAGYPDGFDTEFMPTSFYEETVRSAQVLQAQLSQIGINADIRTLEWGTWLEEEGAGNFDMYICGWLGNIDPDDFFYAQHHTDQVFNFTGYSNLEVDELLDAGRTETDQEARKEIYDQVQQVIIDEAPYVYLYNPSVVNAWQPHVRGYQALPSAAIRFENTWLDR